MPTYIGPPLTQPLQRNQQPYLDMGGVRYSWDPATGRYVDSYGHAPGDTFSMGTAPASPSSAPAPPPAPDPFADWNGSNAGSRSYRYFSPDLQQYYEQHPDEAYRQYSSSEFGDRQTPLSDYAKGRYQDYWADYIQASESNPNLHWTDYLSGDHASAIRNGFQLQSPSQKGYTDTFMPAGRFTG